MWQTVSQVTSAITLVAFAVAAIVTILRLRLNAREKQLLAAAEKDRPALVQSLNDSFLVPSLPVDPSRLTREQAYTLILEQIHDRSRRFYVTSILVAFLATVTAAVAVYAMSRGQADTRPSSTTGASDPVHSPLPTPPPSEDQTQTSTSTATLEQRLRHMLEDVAPVTWGGEATHFQESARLVSLSGCTVILESKRTERTGAGSLTAYPIAYTSEYTRRYSFDLRSVSANDNNATLQILSEPGFSTIDLFGRDNLEVR